MRFLIFILYKDLIKFFEHFLKISSPVFAYEFYESFKSRVFTEHLRVTVSDLFSVTTFKEALLQSVAHSPKLDKTRKL